MTMNVCSHISKNKSKPLIESLGAKNLAKAHTPYPKDC
jgi:hypothetical protein